MTGFLSFLKNSYKSVRKMNRQFSEGNENASFATVTVSQSLSCYGMQIQTTMQQCLSPIISANIKKFGNILWASVWERQPRVRGWWGGGWVAKAPMGAKAALSIDTLHTRVLWSSRSTSKNAFCLSEMRCVRCIIVCAGKILETIQIK